MCVSVEQRGNSGDGVCLRRFCLDINIGWDIFCSELGERGVLV